MSKKRVHELGQAAQGARHRALQPGARREAPRPRLFDVKSHSSSLEDDQAARPRTSRSSPSGSPRPPPPRPAGPGFVVRKQGPRRCAAASRQSPPTSYLRPSRRPSRRPRPSRASRWPSSRGRPVEARCAGAPAETPSPPRPRPRSPRRPRSPPRPPPLRQRRPPAARRCRLPTRRPAALRPPPAPSRPAAAALPRGPAPRAAHGSRAPRGPAPAGRPSIPRTLRPTSTQAVVISRPLIPVRRVTPPTSARRASRPRRAPGRSGEVRELKVVPGIARPRARVHRRLARTRSAGGAPPGAPSERGRQEPLRQGAPRRPPSSDRTYMPDPRQEEEGHQEGSEDADHRARRAQEGHPHRGVDLASRRSRRPWASRPPTSSAS